MTALVANVDNTVDTFGQWITKTNQAITVIRNQAVTTDSNTAVGNASISGTFSANSFFASNGGMLAVGNDSANLVINTSAIIIYDSPTANLLITGAGITIDTSTVFSKLSISMGNTVITTANISVDNFTIRDSITIANSTNQSTINPLSIYSYYSNSNFAVVANNVTVGDNSANIVTTRDTLTISYDPYGTYVTNTVITSTTITTTDIIANTLTLLAPSNIFTSNIEFAGANNYFDLNLTSNGNAKFIGSVEVIGNTNFTGANNTFNVINANTLTVNTFTSTDGITVNPSVTFNGSTSGAVTIQANAVTSTVTFTLPAADGTSQQYIGTDGAGKLSFQSLSGNNTIDFRAKSIGVGTAATGSAGEIRATGNITAFYSDERLKTKIAEISNALEKVCSLSGFYYRANEKAQELGYDGDTVHVGLSAQEVQNVLPEVVVPAPIDSNYLTVQYEKIIPLLVEAIKELKAEVDSLKNGNKN